MPPKPPAQPKLTHFLCLPLITPASRPRLQKSLGEFRQAVTNKSTLENPDGIPVVAIRPVGTLHLTLGVMSLLTTQDLEKATACLELLDTKSLLQAFNKTTKDGSRGTGNSESVDASRAPVITLKGLENMHGQDPAATSVLYAPPEDESGAFQTFCQAVRDNFIKESLIVMPSRPLIVHATIVNTAFVPIARSSGRGSHGGMGSKFVVDARVLLEEWRDFEWIKDLTIDRVAICLMGARKIEGAVDDEEYIEVKSVSLP